MLNYPCGVNALEIGTACGTRCGLTTGYSYRASIRLALNFHGE